MLIVKYEFAAWNDGHTLYEKIEEFNGIKDAIDSLSHIAIEHAINDIVDITFTIPAGSEENITNGIKDKIQQHKIKMEINRLKAAIEEHTKWLDNLTAETNRRTEALETLQDQLKTYL